MNNSRNQDLRNWVEHDGFGPEFRMEFASNADCSQSSVTGSSEGSRSSTPADLITEHAGTSNQAQKRMDTVHPPHQNEEPALASTPAPEQITEKQQSEECLTSILDTVRDVQMSISDVKAEIDALNSKWLLRELEHNDLKVNKLSLLMHRK